MIPHFGYNTILIFKKPLVTKQKLSIWYFLSSNGQILSQYIACPLKHIQFHIYPTLQIIYFAFIWLYYINITCKWQYLTRKWTPCGNGKMGPLSVNMGHVGSRSKEGSRNVVSPKRSLANHVSQSWSSRWIWVLR
jgi:hypothetical protein